MNLEAIAASLESFVSKHQVTFQNLGTRQTQILELAATVGVIRHYSASGFAVSIQNPSANNVFVLKSSTRGHPADYSRVQCVRGGHEIEIHTNLLVRGAHDEGIYCVDVAVVRVDVVPHVKTKDKWRCVENADLVSFGEAKKLVIYPMLLAQFLGIVHEIRPEFLLPQPRPDFGPGGYLPPVLMALGVVRE